MQAYLLQLQKNPLRTKMLTSGALSGLQELLASYIAKDRSKSGHYFTSRVPKMAANGAFIMAPVGHVLITLLQKLFAGRTSLKAKILQILVSNLFVSITRTSRTNIRSNKEIRLPPSKTPFTSAPWPSSPAPAPSTKCTPPGARVSFQS